MVRVITLENSHANGRSKLRWGRKSTCISKILSWKKVQVVEQIIYYCTTAKMTRVGWLEDIVQQGLSHLYPLPITFTWNFILMCHWDLGGSMQPTTLHYQQQVNTPYNITPAVQSSACATYPIKISFFEAS